MSGVQRLALPPVQVRVQAAPPAVERPALDLPAGRPVGELSDMVEFSVRFGAPPADVYL